MPLRVPVEAAEKPEMSGGTAAASSRCAWCLNDLGVQLLRSPCMRAGRRAAPRLVSICGNPVAIRSSLVQRTVGVLQ